MLAQRSDTEEHLWKLYDLSSCCQSGPRRKATKNAERRGGNEGEEKLKKTKDYINRRRNTKPPNQNRSPHTTSDTSVSSSLVKSLSRFSLKNIACQSLGWCPPFLGKVARGRCPLVSSVMSQTN